MLHDISSLFVFFGWVFFLFVCYFFCEPNQTEIKWRLIDILQVSNKAKAVPTGIAFPPQHFPFSHNLVHIGFKVAWHRLTAE